MLPKTDAAGVRVKMIVDVPGLGKAGETVELAGRQAVRTLRSGRAEPVVSKPVERAEKRASTPKAKKKSKKK